MANGKKLGWRILLAGYLAVVVYVRVTPVYKGILVPMDLSYLAAAVVASLAASYAMMMTRGRPIHSFVRLAGVGVILWLAGEAVWIYYELVTGEFPYPSIADLLYILAYPLWLMAILREVKMEYFSLKGKWIVPSMVGLLLLAALTFYYGIIQSYSIESPILENLTSMAYGLSDLMVLVVAALAVRVATVTGKHVRTFTYIALAMGLTWVADILYYTIFTEFYDSLVVPYRLIDLLWIGWYLLMARAFYSLAREEVAIDPKASEKNSPGSA